MAYLPLTSFVFENASPKIPARLGSISRLIADLAIRPESELAIAECVGQRQKFG